MAVEWNVFSPSVRFESFSEPGASEEPFQICPLGCQRGSVVHANHLGAAAKPGVAKDAGKGGSTRWEMPSSTSSVTSEDAPGGIRPLPGSGGEWKHTDSTRTRKYYFFSRPLAGPSQNMCFPSLIEITMDSPSFRKPCIAFLA